MRRKMLSICYVAQARVRATLSKAGRIAGNRLAAYLSRKDAGLTVRQRKAWCILFILVFGGSSTWILVDTMLHPSRNLPVTFTPSRIPRTSSADRLPVLSSKDTAHIRLFRQMIDSLHQTAAGRLQLESLYYKRPGLLDSFYTVEQMIK